MAPPTAAEDGSLGRRQSGAVYSDAVLGGLAGSGAAVDFPGLHFAAVEPLSICVVYVVGGGDEGGSGAAAGTAAVATERHPLLLFVELEVVMMIINAHEAACHLLCHFVMAYCTTQSAVPSVICAVTFWQCDLTMGLD